MTAVAAPTHCPACDAPPTRGLRLSNGKDLLRCPSCGLGWWEWPPFDPTAFYDRDYFQSTDATKGYDDYASLEVGVRRTARTRLRNLARVLEVDEESRLRRSGSLKPPRKTTAQEQWHKLETQPTESARNSSLFEIGCGTGLFLDEARRAGWVTAGNEVSLYAAGRARERGLCVDSAPIEDTGIPTCTSTSDGLYDCVAMWDVIEHVRDPRGVIATAAAALRPGGVLAISTGDLTSWCARLSGAKWHLFNLPEHLFFFSPQCLTRLAERAGCTLEMRRDEVNWVPMSYAFERIQKPLLGRARLRLPRFASGWVIPATLGDVMGLYFRKRDDAA